MVRNEAAIHFQDREKEKENGDFIAEERWRKQGRDEVWLALAPP